MFHAATVPCYGVRKSILAVKSYRAYVVTYVGTRVYSDLRLGCGSYFSVHLWRCFIDMSCIMCNSAEGNGVACLVVCVDAISLLTILVKQ
jgi:hypothetical protein